MTHEQEHRLSDQDFEDYLEGRSRLTPGYERLKAYLQAQSPRLV